METFIHILIGMGIASAIIGGFLGAFMYGLSGKGMPWIFRPFLFLLMPDLFLIRWGLIKRKR